MQLLHLVWYTAKITIQVYVLLTTYLVCVFQILEIGPNYDGGFRAPGLAAFLAGTTTAIFKPDAFLFYS